MRMTQRASQDVLKEHYKEHAQRKFYQERLTEAKARLKDERTLVRLLSKHVYSKKDKDKINALLRRVR